MSLYSFVFSLQPNACTVVRIRERREAMSESSTFKPASPGDVEEKKHKRGSFRSCIFETRF